MNVNTSKTIQWLVSFVLDFEKNGFLFYRTRKQTERNAKIMEIQAYQSEVHQEQASNQKYLMYGKTRLNDLSKRVCIFKQNNLCIIFSPLMLLNVCRLTKLNDIESKTMYWL
jgi:hypothetical protein